jgi:hypothetical protein
MKLKADPSIDKVVVPGGIKLRLAVFIFLNPQKFRPYRNKR